MFTETIIEPAVHHESLASGLAATHEFDVLPSAHPIPTLSTSWCNRPTHGDGLLFLFSEVGRSHDVYTGFSGISAH